MCRTCDVIGGKMGIREGHEEGAKGYKLSEGRFSNACESYSFGERTLSKLTTIDPTLVAPTGIMLKNPCFQRPSSATRSLRTKRLAIRRAMYGETLKSSPVHASTRPKIKSVTRPKGGMLRVGGRTSKVPSPLHNPSSRTMEPMIISRRKIHNRKEQLVILFHPASSPFQRRQPTHAQLRSNSYRISPLALYTGVLRLAGVRSANFLLCSVLVHGLVRTGHVLCSA